MHAIPPIFDSLLRAAAFFMFKQRLSIKTFGRRVYACWVCFQIKNNCRLLMFLKLKVFQVFFFTRLPSEFQTV